jgi:hypothetical protein
MTTMMTTKVVKKKEIETRLIITLRKSSFVVNCEIETCVIMDDQLLSSSHSSCMLLSLRKCLYIWFLQNLLDKRFLFLHLILDSKDFGKKKVLLVCRALLMSHIFFSFK